VRGEEQVCTCDYLGVVIGMSVRVILGDDHKVFRQGLRTLLEREADIDVVGEAGDGRTTVKICNRLSPDMVLMDISMPDLNGIEATRQIIEENPKTKVIALSQYSDGRFISAMIKAGASGYLLKDCAFEEVVQAIRAVEAGRVHFSPSIMDVVVKDYVQQVHGNDSSVCCVLTAKEREVLQLIAEGNTMHEIASKLNLSVKTIETHRVKIMNKLNTRSIADLTKYAIREGLISL
jgi:two-component system response regulator NreC